MIFPLSALGLVLAGVYVVGSIFLILTQGLFGESFIALILGLPWSMIFAFFEYGGVNGSMLYILVIAPMVLNAIILYWIGARIQSR